MRLIDLDQTIFVPIIDESQGGMQYEMQMTVAETFDKFFDGFQPQVVDAIPVEWLEKQADYARSEWDYDTCEGIRIVLKTWQKEQEGR